jgi:hypothetical protein
MIKIVNMGDGVISAAADDYDDTNDENAGAASLTPGSRVVAVTPAQKNVLTPYRPKSSSTSGPHIFVRHKR